MSPASGAVVQTVGPIGFSLTGLAVDPTTGTRSELNIRDTFISLALSAGEDPPVA